MYTILGWLVYVIMFMVTMTGTFAYWQREYPKLAKKNYRQDLGFSITFALIPIGGWIIAFLLSGFYEHGFMLRRPK